MTDCLVAVGESVPRQVNPPTFERLFALEEVGRDRFAGVTHDHGHGRIFGGLVLAQALLASYRSVGPRICHSLHAYFLRTGDLKIPVVYEVERARDGRSFCTRRVTATQDGVQIFNLTASFQAWESGFEHQIPSPPSLPPPPQRTESPASVIQAMLDMRAMPLAEGLGPGHKSVAVRTRRPAGGTAPLQQAILAYASDVAFMEAALQPHGLAYGQAGFQGASLDHTIWFHHPATLDEWIHFSQVSPSASGGRGLILGQMFDPRGRLVASIAQECLMRVRRET